MPHININTSEWIKAPLKDFISRIKEIYPTLLKNAIMLPSGEFKEDSLLDVANSLLDCIDQIDTYCTNRNRY